jgi:hypothetical protein
LTDPAGVGAQRPGALERVGLVLADWQHTRTRQADTKARLITVLDAMSLTVLVTSIPGLSAVGAAVTLAETGDLSRFASARSVVKHAGLNRPRTPRPPSAAKPDYRAAAGPGYDWPPGAPSGAPCPTTGCYTPSSPT